VILSGSFGFFGDREDQELLCSIRKALKIGGKVFIMFKSAHRQFEHARDYREIDDGWEFSEGWFDTETSTKCGTIFIIRKDGTMIVPKKEPGYHANERIRCYTIPEMQKMLSKAGLTYVASYSDRYLDVPVKPVAKDCVRNIIVGQRC
jgi:hypothetical protein